MSSSALLNDGRMPGSRHGARNPALRGAISGRTAAGHFREIRGGLVLSSIGIGTYLGEPDEATDGAYTDASSLRSRAESTWWIPRSITASSAANAPSAQLCRSCFPKVSPRRNHGLHQGGISHSRRRNARRPEDDIFRRNIWSAAFFARKISPQGCHCMAPALSGGPTRSQPPESGRRMHGRLLSAQSRNAVKRSFAGRISPPHPRGVRVSGIGGRVGTNRRVRHGDVECVSRGSEGGGLSFTCRDGEIAREVGGDDHHFRFVQLPFNLAMPEALTRPNQVVER